MNDSDPPGVPQASVRDRPRRRFSLIWIIPIVTAAVGAWLAWDAYSKRGPTITISFQTGEGLQAGQSQVKHKDVTMGTVRSIELSEDFSHVEVKVEMRREAVPLLTTRTKFWVVKPRFFAGNISGLETLLSGGYIELLPSQGGEPQRAFVGLEEPPVLQTDVPGRTFLLKADRIGSLSLGSPIFFRDLNVGQVLGYDVADMAQSVTIHAFVRSPFDKYVNAKSRFWNASGLSVNLGPQGVKVELESIRALILGGIAFDTPTTEPGEQPSDPVSDRATFPLYADREAAETAGYGRQIKFVSYFQGSVRGLAGGAVVSLRGLRIGQVTGVRLQFDAEQDKVLARVEYEVQPQRIFDMQGRPLGERQDPVAEVRGLVARGLRAQLQSTNLITGQQLVALDFYPEAPEVEMSQVGDRMLIPTLQGSEFNDIARSAGDLLEKINNIPFEQIGKNLNNTLEGLNEVANGAQLKQSLASLQTTLAGVQDVVKRMDTGLSPALQRLPQIAAGLQQTIDRTSRLVGSVDTGYGGDSRLRRDLDRLLSQLNDTASSIRVLADLLTRHPEALIRGRTKGVE